jgi:hypothetical protein
MTRIIYLVVLLCGILPAQSPQSVDARLAAMDTAVKAAQSAGDNAWMLVCSALVLMMANIN